LCKSHQTTEKDAPNKTYFMKRSVIRRSPSWTTGVTIHQIILILLASNIVTSQRGRDNGPIYNSGIQYRAYGGGKSFPIQSLPESLWKSDLGIRTEDVGYKDIKIADEFESKFEARSAKRKQPQQVDQSMVAQMLKNPDAMKMVLHYLTKQNLNEHQKNWNQMSKSKKHGKNKRKKNIGKKKLTTAKPRIITTTTTTRRSNVETSSKSPIIQITQINRRKDDAGDKQKKKRRPRPPGGDFFDLAQLFKLASLGGKLDNRRKPGKGKENDKKQRPSDLSFLFGPPLRKRPPPTNRRPSQRPTPPANTDNLNNPQLLGDKPKLEYFGPSDFVPQHPYALPMQQHGPMKLTYMSAKEFPNIPKYGLIPIPRR